MIGYAGTEDKVNWLKKDLGFDVVFNYKKTSIPESLEKGAPKGVDCFFENVGGEDSTAIMSKMNQFGRVAICGFIASYNARGEPEKVSSTHAPILTNVRLSYVICSQLITYV